MFHKTEAVGQKNNTVIFAIFSLLFASTPVMAEQFSFTLQNWEVMSGICIVALGVWIFLEFMEGGKLKYLFLSSILLAWCIGLYQVLVCLFVLGILSVLLLRNCNGTDKDIKLSDILKIGLKFFECIFLAMAIYFWASRIMQYIQSAQSSSGYLLNNFKWFEQGIKQSVIEVVQYIRNLIWSQKYYYSSFIYGIIFVVFLLLSLTYKNKIYNLLLRIAIVLSPFYFPILFGDSILMRIQIVLPLTVAICGSVILYDFVQFRRGGGEATIIRYRRYSLLYL